jgi:hypothetical protein
MRQSVLFEYVLTKVISILSPYGVNVIGIIQESNIVILDDEIWTVDHVIVSFHGFIATDPTKINLIHSSSMKDRKVFLSFRMV